jgi:Uma2 family endonuclease
MSVASLLPFQSAAEALPRKRFTRKEVERYIEAGFFEGQRFELIDGDLLDKMGQKPPHSASIQLLLATLAKLLDIALIRIQLPIEASGADRERSLPEPDVAVLAEPKPDYHKRHPRGDELVLVVEVSDTTAGFDLTRKAVLYASAGVPEYWVLDLTRRMLVVHRRPDGSTYRLLQLFSEADTVSMEGRSDTLRVSEILPDRS